MVEASCLCVLVVISSISLLLALNDGVADVLASVNGVGAAVHVL